MERLHALWVRLPLAAYALVVLAFLYVPMLLVVLFSLNAGGRLGFPMEGFSFRWYREVLSDPVYVAALINSLIVGVMTAAATAVLGTLASFGIAAAPRRIRAPLAVLFFTPITLPGLFLGLSLLAFFSRLQVHLSLYTVAAAHFVFTFPYFVLVARAALERLDPQLDEVGADLGASAVQRFVKITLPLVWPILAAATVLAFALSFDEFFITFFVIGPESTTPMVIYSSMRRTIDPSINAVATLLLAITALAGLLTGALVGVRRHVRKAVTGP